MKTVIEMAREAGFMLVAEPDPDTGGWWECFDSEIETLVALVRADEREQIAQMIQDAPPLVEFAQNEHGGCLMCGFTPRLAADHIRARSQA